MLAVYQERTGAPWRFVGWQIGPAGPARLPVHLDDLLADTGRPGAYLQTVTSLAVT